LKCAIEAPYALEACFKGNIAEREVGIADKFLCSLLSLPKT
jgi:hypothetical protein